MDLKKRIETLFENNQTKEFIHNYTGILPEIIMNSCHIKIIFEDDYNYKVLRIIFTPYNRTNNIFMLIHGTNREETNHCNYFGPIEKYSNDLLIPFLEVYSDYFRHGYVLK
jgi:hypothetical protein